MAFTNEQIERYSPVVSNVPLSTNSSLIVTVTYSGVSTFSSTTSCANLKTH